MKKFIICVTIAILLLTGCGKGSGSEEFLAFINDSKIWSTSYSKLSTDPDFVPHDERGDDRLTTKEPLHFVYTDIRPDFLFSNSSDDHLLTEIQLTLGNASRGSGKMDAQYKEVIAWLKKNCGFLEGQISVTPEGGTYSDSKRTPCTVSEINEIPARPKGIDSQKIVPNECFSAWKSDLCVITVYYLMYPQNDDFEVRIEFLDTYY